MIFKNNRADIDSDTATLLWRLDTATDTATATGTAVSGCGCLAVAVAVAVAVWLWLFGCGCLAVDCRLPHCHCHTATDYVYPAVPHCHCHLPRLTQYTQLDPLPHSATLPLSYCHTATLPHCHCHAVFGTKMTARTSSIDSCHCHPTTATPRATATVRRRSWDRWSRGPWLGHALKWNGRRFISHFFWV
jgi:hypothetical protein